MQSEIVDRKLSVLYDHYQEKPYVRHAQQEVEGIRNSATNFGFGISTGAFVLNEFARMKMRSRKSILISLNPVFLYYSPLQTPTTQCSFLGVCSNCHVQIGFRKQGAIQNRKHVENPQE